MGELTVYTAAINLARLAPSRTILFDPHSYVEEYSWIEWQLARNPAPLKLDNPALDYLAPEASTNKKQPSRTGAPRSTTKLKSAGGKTKQKRSEATVTPTLNCLDSVVRIAALLYTEEMFPECHTVDPYGVLYRLLNKHFKVINARLSKGASMWSDQSLPPPDQLRPILIWVCLVACTVGRIIELEVSFKVRTTDFTPYQCALAHLIPLGSMGVDSLPESDFRLCKLLPIELLRVTCSGYRHALKTIMFKYEASRLVGFEGNRVDLTGLEAQSECIDVTC